MAETGPHCQPHEHLKDQVLDRDLEASREQANDSPGTSLNLLHSGVLPCFRISLNLEPVALPTNLVSTIRPGSGEEWLTVTEQHLLPLCFVIWKDRTRFDALALRGTEAAHGPFPLGLLFICSAL